jgi:hypothetical protein
MGGRGSLKPATDVRFIHAQPHPVRLAAKDLRLSTERTPVRIRYRMPSFVSRELVQWLERRPLEANVGGSNPSLPAKFVARS